MKILYLVLLLSLHHQTSQAQNRFTTNIIAGLNFAELEGASIIDYFGINTGLQATARLSPKTQLGIEILYSQNGEYILPDYYPPIQYGKVRLNHLEIPIHLAYDLPTLQKGKKHDWNINIGVAYIRLFNYQAEDSQQNDVTNQLIYGQKDTFIPQIGLTYRFTKKIGLNLKTSLPLNQALDYTLAARLVYSL